MALIMLGIRWAFTLVSIPLVLALILVALVIAGLPAALIGGLVALLASRDAALIAAAVVAAPLFFLLLIMPLAAIGGVFTAFEHNVWTLTYRELVAFPAPEAVLDEPEQPEEPEQPTESGAAEA